MFGSIVVHGNHNGKRYGFATANLKIDEKNKLQLSTGVYAGFAELNKKKYGAAIAISPNLKMIEVHLLDYSGEDFYGQYLEFEPLQKVSEMERFDNENELIKKISEDIIKVRNILDTLNQ